MKVVIPGLLAAVLVSIAGRGEAQVLGNMCQTAYGVCAMPGLFPMGSGCACNGIGGFVMNPVASAGPAFGGACATQWGVCRVPPMPMGSFCACGQFGGRIAGP